ncbi:zonadhesin-like isoform X2 [Epargyreus clarus]|uniref:zonadhesin-like isoform X2 n=1 Tax=Epargyreus clarus TaxID=520877 RepID=UPI003C2B915E
MAYVYLIVFAVATASFSPASGTPSDRPPPNQGSNKQTSASAAAYAQSSNGESRASATAKSYSSSTNSGSSSYSSASSYASSKTTNGPGPGEVRNCTYNKCTPTCSLPNPTNCPEDSNPCNCPPGTIISDVGGQCVQREECQNYQNCKGDYNASYTDCSLGCPSTCAKPDGAYCNTTCGTSECKCDPGYLLSENNGKCIKPDDCAGGYPCKQNETFVNCLVDCPNIYCPVNDGRYTVACGAPFNCPPGCDCKRNYMRKSVDEYTCILASDCPPVNCTRQFEEWSSCPKPCFSDYCRDRYKVSTPEDCPYSGEDCRPQCVCKQGYYRNDSDICVPAEQCEYTNCKGDYNASYTECSLGCPSTCAKPDADYCNTKCGTSDCTCNFGYLLSEDNGKCIKPDDCPGGYPCKQNETFVSCAVRCPEIYCPENDDRYTPVCDPPMNCPPGCGCKGNYRRKSVNDFTCILASDCPPVNCTRQFEEWSSCPEPCFSDFCRDRNRVIAPGDCPSSGPDCRPQCVCKQGYYRNETEICVPAKDCRTLSRPKCGKNEVAVPCKTICPPQACNISYTTYSCEKKQKCIPGCDCIRDYLRTNEGVCVLNDNCPPPPGNNNPVPPSEEPPKSPSGSSATAYSQSSSYSSSSSSSSHASASSYSSSHVTNHGSGGTKPQCGKNETLVPCKTLCPPQACNISYTDYVCDSEQKCIPGCDCIPNYLRNDDGVCIYNEECPGPKQVLDCTFNACTPTCSLPYPQNCPPDSNPCNCPPGFLVSEQGGKCVPREECEKYANCKGDYNATYVNCPIGCPSTCAKPDAEYCGTECGTAECACDPSYILDKKDGNCIKPDDCPGGYPCKQNETFVGCLIRCPNIYCPVDDNRGILICDPARNCPSGCGCKRNYLRKSVDDYTCILARECPPVNCTRPFEEWNPCPEPCFSDSCRDRNRVSAPGDCRSYGPDCRPQCVCKEGYFRNGTDICVTAKECPPGDQY